MKRTIALSLGVVAGILAAAAAYWYGLYANPEAGKSKKAVVPVPVLVMKAGVKDMPVLLEVVGRAEAYETVTLRARVDGQVETVSFVPGQRVKQGEELIRLDSVDFALRLRQAQANVAKDEAQFAKSRADTARYTALRDRGFVSEEKVNDMRTVEAAARATLHADQAAVDLARSQLSYATIRAPFAGVVGAKLIFPGGTVKTNETLLAVINRVRPIYVTFAVPEKYLPRLRSAMSDRDAACKKGGCLKVDIGLSGDKSRRIEGTASFLDNAVDMASGTIQMKAVVDNQDEALTPGQFLEVRLFLDHLRGSVVVASEAVQQGPDGPFLFVVNAEGKAELRKIDVAASSGGLTAVSKGVQSGETVVTDGQLRLIPGTPVQVKTNEANAGKPASGGKTQE